MNQQNKGFTFIEILIVLALSGFVILTAISVNITSRRFFSAASRQARIQDEAKIAMEHIVHHIQQGIGDMSYPSGDPPTINNNSRGFFVLSPGGNLVTHGSGSSIRVKIDESGDGIFDTTPAPYDDALAEYAWDSVNYNILFNPNLLQGGTSYPLGSGMIETLTFTVDINKPSQLEVEITVRYDPNSSPGPNNPETTLTSSIALRAMSCN